VICGIGMTSWSFSSPQMDTALVRLLFIGIVGFIFTKW
jgi:hypothetical protein